MGKKSKGSRKGKKEWRANISSEDIEDFFEKSTKEAHSGGSLSNVPADSLFYVDTSHDVKVKRKVEKKREKMLWCDSIIFHKNPFVQGLPSSKRTSKTKKIIVNKGRTVQTQLAQPFDVKEKMVDLWDQQDDSANVQIRTSKPINIPAVEVEPPGCSYNPEHEAHQDSLAQAVAEEMNKVYRDKLGPQPIPLVVPGRAVNEEDMYFLEVDADEDEDSNDELANDDGISVTENRATKIKRVTRVELNKRARLKEMHKNDLLVNEKKQLSEAIDGLTEIMKEIEKEDEERHKKSLRRKVMKEERLKTRPPRLGKRKFVPPPAQVLLSEEINGSLRQLKGCCTLLNDRFKSFQKRGLIEPA